MLTRRLIDYGVPAAVAVLVIGLAGGEDEGEGKEVGKEGGGLLKKLLKGGPKAPGSRPAKEYIKIESLGGTAWSNARSRLHRAALGVWTERPRRVVGGRRGATHALRSPSLAAVATRSAR